MEFENEDVDIRPYTHKQLAAMYNTTGRTFKTWLEKFKDELGERTGHYYSIKQVKIIFSKLDVPCKIKKKNN
jgi:hypothetical protein